MVPLQESNDVLRLLLAPFLLFLFLFLSPSRGVFYSAIRCASCHYTYFSAGPNKCTRLPSLSSFLHTDIPPASFSLSLPSSSRQIGLPVQCRIMAPLRCWGNMQEDFIGITPHTTKTCGEKRRREFELLREKEVAFFLHKFFGRLVGGAFAELC